MSCARARTALTAALALSLSSAAYADAPVERAHVEINSDGSVEVGSASYPSIEAFQTSPQFATGGHRCGTPEPPPIFEASPSDCSTNSTTIQPEYDPTPGSTIFQIPVVFHIIRRTDGTGEITDDLIRSQIDILNEDFRAIPGSLGAPGTDARIEFYLATQDPDGNPTTGINRVSNNTWYNDGGNFKSSLRWDTNRYLNIYTNSAGGALGYATFPSSVGSSSDGVVLLWSSVGRDAPEGGRYDKGRTGTHEVGHYFGLHHTFNGGCGNSYTSGDRIVDTVPENGPEYECVEQASACGGGNNPIHNYMDYTPDECMYRFTPEQVNRMRCSLFHYRTDLPTEGDINESPLVSFTYEAADLQVSFLDTTTDDGALSAWAWDFGDGATGTGQNPMHTYAAEGTYPVSLEVTDDLGAAGEAQMDVVANVLPTAAFSFETAGLTVTFVDASEDVGALSFEWDFGDGQTSTEQNPTHAFPSDGSYPVSLTVTDEFGATDTAQMTVTAGSMAPDAGIPPGGDGDAGVDNPGNEDDGTVTGGCGCSTGSGTGTTGALLLLGLVALAFRKRR